MAFRHVEVCRNISIHPPREGWDVYFFFVPNRLVWISIHPPREGWDQMMHDMAEDIADFNPPTP